MVINTIDADLEPALPLARPADTARVRVRLRWVLVAVLALVVVAGIIAVMVVPGLRRPAPGNPLDPAAYFSGPGLELARAVDAVIERAEALSLSGNPVNVEAPWWFWNLFGEQAVFLLRRK